MRTISRNILKVIEWVVFIMLLFMLFLVASSLLPTKDFLSTYSVSTGSMEPSINAGSLVFVSQSEKYQEGDILVFQSPKSSKDTIVHRVVQIEEEGSGKTYQTKGDANETIDDWSVMSGQVKGKVFLTLPFMGGFIESLRSPGGFVLLLAIPVLIFIIMQFFKIREGINEEVEKRTEIEVEKRLGSIEKFEKREISIREELNSYVKGNNINKNYVLLLGLALTGFLFLAFSGNAYALFSSKTTITGMNISISDEIIWTGGLEVINKTNGDNLNSDSHHAFSEISQNIVFRPENMSQDAHHFTIIIKRMSDDSMIHFRTMLTRWTMDNFRKDGHLGYTFWETGDFWLQVNSYHADGSVDGYYYAILTIDDITFVPVLVEQLNIEEQNFEGEDTDNNDLDVEEMIDEVSEDTEDYEINEEADVKEEENINGKTGDEDIEQNEQSDSDKEK